MVEGALLSQAEVQHPHRDLSRSPEELFRQGKQALADGQLSLAEDCFRQVIILDPRSAAAHINLAVTSMRQKRWDNALGELQLAQVLAPDEPGIQLNLGLAYYRQNNYTAATEPLAAFLQQNPGSLQARYLLGLCYFFTDRYKEATSTLAPLWDSQSTHLNYLYVLAIASSKASEAPLQQRAFNRMLEIGQNSPEFHLYMGKAFLAQDDVGRALAEFQAAVSAQPSLPLVHYYLGRAYLEQHAYSKAESELLQDVSLEPDFAYAYEDLGILYAERGQTPQAEHSFQQALERNALLVNSCIGLAKLYRKEGRLADALVQLNNAARLAPQAASVHFLKGQVLAGLGDATGSKFELKTSAALLSQFNEHLQQEKTGDQTVDAQSAAEQ